jgi:hypothetical protein
MGIADELAKLEELRRSGALSESEFAQAKAAILSGSGSDASLDQHMSEQLAEVRYQNELAQIDREWQIERERYLITNNYGLRTVPTAGLGIATALIGGVGGLLWTIFAFWLTHQGPDGFGPPPIVGIIFPLFGVLFMGVGVGYGSYCYSPGRPLPAGLRALPGAAPCRAAGRLPLTAGAVHGAQGCPSLARRVGVPQIGARCFRTRR